jgi:phytoene/squalene synthetase
VRPAPQPRTLGAAYERCRQLHARHGRTYYLATLLLPRWKRRHVHALYGFTRSADEIVDDLDSTLDPARRAAALRAFGERFFAGLRGVPCDDPLLPAVLHTVRAFDLDPGDFERFLDAMAADLHTDGYRSYDDLCGYMEGSAAVIGTMMVPILEPTDPPAAREHARQLGLAFQLTNFIRDVAEDSERGRVYLPAADLQRFGVRPGRPGRRRGHPRGPSAAGLRGHPGPGPLPGRRARHRAARPLLPGVCPGRLRAVCRHPGRGRAGRLPDPRPPGPGPPPPPPRRRRPPPPGRPHRRPRRTPRQHHHPRPYRTHGHSPVKLITDPQKPGPCPHVPLPSRWEAGPGGGRR